MLRTVLLNNPPVDMGKAAELIESVLAAAQYAIHALIHRTFGISPGALAFKTLRVFD
jgi:hypothetical protein